MRPYLDYTDFISNKNESLQYNAALAITVAIRGSSTINCT